MTNNVKFIKILIVNCNLSEDIPGKYYRTIKGAVDYLGSDGGVVIVENGNYTIDNVGDRTTISIPNNVKILGKGNVLITLQANIPLFKNSGAEQNGSNNNIIISGLTIVVDYKGVYDQNVIDMKQVSNCILENLYITSNYCQVSNSKAAIKFQGELRSGKPSIGNIVSGCTITNFGYPPRYGTGIHFYQTCEYNIIRCNNFSKTYNGIVVEEIQHSIISDNVIQEMCQKGIHVSKSDFTIVDGNQLFENDSHGIYIDQSRFCTIEGNTCKYNKGHGICLDGDALLHTDHNTVINNFCYENYDQSGMICGIYLNKDAGYSIINNNNCNSNKSYGIRSEGMSNYNVFIGNICNENNDGSIQYQINSQGKMNVISNNIPSEYGKKSMVLRGLLKRIYSVIYSQ